MRRWLFLLALVAGQAAALPEAVRAESPAGNVWRQWGSGEMRWFGLALYRATLWVAGEPAAAVPGEPAAAVSGGVPLALALEYRRDIPGERIVTASVDEMRKLGAGDAELERWAAEMRRLFPDVKKGDVLTGVFAPGRGARFFHHQRELGEVRDAEFARRFFAIWLDPRTSAPEVRAALLRGAGTEASR